MVQNRKRRAPRRGKVVRRDCPEGRVPMTLTSARLADLSPAQRSTARNILTMWVKESTKLPYIRVHVNHAGDVWEVLRGEDIRLAPSAVVGTVTETDIARGEDAQLGGIAYNEVLCVRPFISKDLEDLIMEWAEWQFAGTTEMVPVAAARHEREPRLMEQPCWPLLGDETARERSIWLADTSVDEASLISFESESLYLQGWRIANGPGTSTGLPALRVRDDLDLYITRLTEDELEQEKGQDEPDVWAGWEVLPVPHLHTPPVVRRILARLNTPGNYVRSDSGGNVHVLRSRLGEDRVAEIWEALASA